MSKQDKFGKKKSGNKFDRNKFKHNDFFLFECNLGNRTKKGKY
jgi:hypothetical protein